MSVRIMMDQGWPRLWHRREDTGTVWWRRTGPFWRVWPDVLMHSLLDRRVLPRPWAARLGARMCAWRGPHGYRYTSAPGSAGRVG